MEAWIYATRQLEWAGILSRIFDTGSTESGYCLALDGKSGIYCGIRTLSGPAQNFYQSTGPNSLSLNAWHHVAATYDGKQIVIYIDGQVKKTYEQQGDIDYDPDHNLTIGAYKDDNDFYAFPGLIAEVRLWNVTRTLEEIRATMSVALRGNEKGLAGYWPLDEGKGTTVTDKSGSAVAGTILNASWENASVPFGHLPVATQWIGNPLSDLPHVDGASNYYFVDQELLIGSTGRISAFRVLAKRANPIELVIYRRTGDSFAMIGKSPVVSIPSPGQHEFVLPSPIAVQKGDLVGWHDLQTGAIAMQILGASASQHLKDRVAFTPDVSGTRFTQSSNRVYAIQVQLEPSAATTPAPTGQGGTPPVDGKPTPDTGRPTTPTNTGGSVGSALVNAMDKARGEEGELAGMLRYNEAVLADSPIGYWKLNERSGTVAQDISGNNRHGTYHGTVKLATQGAFAEGDAVVFDGKTGYVEITTANWGGGKELTIEAWVNVREQSSDFQAVVSALGQEFVHLQLHSAGNIAVYTDTGYTLLPILPQAPLNVWRHLALTVGGGSAKLYVDGELSSSAQGNFTTIRPTHTIRIGGGYAGGRFFNGAIDEVAIYNYALPQDRIKERVRIVQKINEVAKRAESPRQQRSFLRLDGKSYVEVKDPFENNKAFTISLWARPSVLDDGYFHGLIGKQGDAYRKPGLWLCPAKGGLHYDSYSTAGQRFGEMIENFFEKNQWVHITWVKRGDKYEFYRNGKLFAERTAPPEFYRADTNYWLGRVDNFWAGDIAEVRFWNVALHPAEVAAEMSRSPRGDDARLAYYWPLNEGEGTVAYDRTGRDDGKILGGAWKREQTPFVLAPDYGDVAIQGAPPPSRHMEPQKKEYYKITTPEQLREQLQHAISLELSTIPPYLYAAYSIKDPKSRASALILGVAFEEMLHMLIACNLLNAIGGTPKMTGPFAPVYPTFIPYHATGGPFIQLQRASRDLMANTFMQIEQPGVGRPLHEMEHGAEFETIGQFYEAIADGFRYCEEHHRLFIGDMARQQKAAYFGGGGGRIVTVTDLDSALRAIGQIVEQGEGTSGAYQGYGSDALEGPPPVGSFGQDRRSRELAHYFKFAAMATGEVEIPETWPMETNFRTSHFGLSPEKKWARDLSDLCNACYVYMLRTMEHALNRPASDGGFFSSSFPLMRSVVTPLGRLLAQTPLRRNNVVDDMQFDKTASEKIAPILVTAGPSFEYIEWSYEKIVETCSALLEPGVCPDDEETCEGYRDVFMETLARVLTALEQVERIHEGER